MLTFDSPEKLAAFYDEQADQCERAAKVSSHTKRAAELNTARAVVWRDAARLLRESLHLPA